jgi:microcystin degradation protein MlrC
MKRIAIVRFWYEGNAFAPVAARRADFAAREWLAGEGALRFYAGTGLETGAAVDFLRDHPDVEGSFVFCAAATPAGPIEAGVFGDVLRNVQDGLGGGHWDGAYLSLHGAAVCADEDQPEIALLKAVRATVGPAPLAASFDLHANLSPEVGALADIVVGYKTYPHTDLYDTGAKALGLLHRAMRGEIAPASTVVPAGFAPGSFNMRTESGPMAEIAAMARAEQEAGGFHDVTPFGGFVYADSRHTGASTSVCAEAGLPGAEAAAQRIAAAFRARAPRFHVRLPVPRPLLEELRALDAGRPVAVLEPSDNPFSGGAGDTPGLLRAVLEVAPDLPSVFAFFRDPALVERAHREGIGARLDCRLGGRLDDRAGAPVAVAAQVETLTDGRFVNHGPMENGMAVDLGRTAVLRVAAVRVIVTSRNVPVNDMGYFRLHGVELDATRVVYAKAKNHFRAAFAAHFERIVEIETPGPAPCDLSTLKFRHLPPDRLFCAGTAT